VTKLDVLRANAFVAEAAGVRAESMSIPVVGGHAGVTILPLLSQARPGCPVWVGPRRVSICKSI
jgi:malate dehydrogenase